MGQQRCVKFFYLEPKKCNKNKDEIIVITKTTTGGKKQNCQYSLLEAEEEENLVQENFEIILDPALYMLRMVLITVIQSCLSHQLLSLHILYYLSINYKNESTLLVTIFKKIYSIEYHLMGLYNSQKCLEIESIYVAKEEKSFPWYCRTQ